MRTVHATFQADGDVKVCLSYDSAWWWFEDFKLQLLHARLPSDTTLWWWCQSLLVVWQCLRVYRGLKSRAVTHCLMVTSKSVYHMTVPDGVQGLKAQQLHTVWWWRQSLSIIWQCLMVFKALRLSSYMLDSHQTQHTVRWWRQSLSIIWQCLMVVRGLKATAATHCLMVRSKSVYHMTVPDGV